MASVLVDRQVKQVEPATGPRKKEQLVWLERLFEALQTLG